METLKFGMKYWKKELPGAIMIQIVSFLAIVADLMLPYLSAIFIDYLICNREITEGSGGVFHFLLTGDYGETQTFELFFNVAIVFMVFMLVRIILIYFKNVYLQHLGLKLETDLRMVTYKKLNELDSMTIAQYNSGELLQIINSDTIMFKEMFCRMIPNIMDSIFVIIVTVIILSGENVGFIIIPIILMPFLIIALMKFKNQAREKFRKIRESSSHMNLTVTENIEAVRLVRSFTNEEFEKKKFDVTNKEVRDANIAQIWLSSKFDVVFNSIKQIAYIGTIAIGAVLVMNGHMNIGFIAASTTYVLKIMDHITQINSTLFQMQQQFVAGYKMKLFMETESKIPDVYESQLKAEQPSISIHNADLEIEGNRVLNNINIDIPYGKKIGIVGGTGSGKSVLLKTLVRIHDLSAGTITINGKDIKDYSLSNLRDLYSYVFQDVFLFSNTVDSNIAYYNPEIDESKVIEAATNAQADAFIRQLSEGYETVIGERGLGISGGQKQRIAISRAILKNAPVLVLDDSTSALDVNTEKKLLSDIKQFYPEKTLIITAHRLSSVVDCDEIVYMQDGKITERGTFDELMKLNGTFAEIYNIQQAQAKAVVDFDAIKEGGVN